MVMPHCNIMIGANVYVCAHHILIHGNNKDVFSAREFFPNCKEEKRMD